MISRPSSLHFPRRSQSVCVWSIRDWSPKIRNWSPSFQRSRVKERERVFWRMVSRGQGESGAERWVSWWIRAAWWSGSLWLREAPYKNHAYDTERRRAVFVLAERTGFPCRSSDISRSHAPLLPFALPRLLAPLLYVPRPPSNRAIARTISLFHSFSLRD